jgi:hypothetical protein
LTLEAVARSTSPEISTTLETSAPNLLGTFDLAAFEKKEQVASLLRYHSDEPPALSAGRVQLGIGSFLFAMGHKPILAQANGRGWPGRPA